MEEIHRKIGILGGTFDPIHNGHLLLGQGAMEEMVLDKILFIPSGHPPHKDNGAISTPEHRCRMIEKAIGSNASFHISTVEVERMGYTYTVDTLTQLKEEYGKEVTFYFIVGADVIPDLLTWKDYGRVFKMCEFVAVLRPGTDKTILINEISRLRSEDAAVIHTVDLPLIEISSRDIRRRVAEGKSIRYLVPDAVEAYIKENSLYTY